MTKYYIFGEMLTLMIMRVEEEHVYTYRNGKWTYSDIITTAFRRYLNTYATSDLLEISEDEVKKIIVQMELMK